MWLVMLVSTVSGLWDVRECVGERLRGGVLGGEGCVRLVCAAGQVGVVSVRCVGFVGVCVAE